MSSSFISETAYGIGKEALMWAPLAVGLITNNATVLTAGEIGYAALHLYNAYYSESKAGKLASLANVAVSLISPFTYHPALTSQIATSTRAHILVGMGGNNVIRGVSEITSVAKNMACGAMTKICGEEDAEETGTTMGKIAGNAIRLGLGIFRVYSGTNQINHGLSQLSTVETPKYEAIAPKKEMDESHEYPKADPKHATEEFKTNHKSTPAPNNQSPKVKSKYAREEFHRNPVIKKIQPKCPIKGGKPHPYDVSFYKRALDSNHDPLKVPAIYTEDRCEGTLYLRSDDTNYLHAKDGVLRAEDTGAIGELSRAAVKELIKDGRVWYRSVEKVRDICKQIDDVHKEGGKIKRLILVGHGNTNEILLSQKNSDKNDIFSRFFNHGSNPNPFDPKYDFKNYDPFKESDPFNDPFLANPFKPAPKISERNLDNYVLDKSVIFPKKGCLNLLEPNAEIILASCQTGAKARGGNIADAIARQAVGHKVIAPFQSNYMTDLKITPKNGNLKFNFKDQINLDYTYVAHVPKDGK